MCTVTWLRNTSGYQVFFNRDEQKAREPATRPSVRRLNNVRYLAPQDGRSGGSWLAVNEHGLTVGLLNYYEAGAPPRLAGAISRGQLVISLMDAASQDEVAKRLHLHALTSYGPFFLLVWAPGRPVHWHRWDGVRRVASILRDDELPVTTSSFDSEAVVGARRRRFEELVSRHGPPTEAALAAYHRSTDPRGGPYSVFMTRPDAETVSYSQVGVTAGDLAYFYAARSPGADHLAPVAAKHLALT